MKTIRYFTPFSKRAESNLKPWYLNGRFCYHRWSAFPGLSKEAILSRICCFLVLWGMLFLLGCRFSSETTARIADTSQPNSSDTPLAEYIQQHLDSLARSVDSPSSAGLVYAEALIIFYQERSWEPVWCGDSRGYARLDSARQLLGNLREYGLLPEFYPFSTILQKEPRSEEEAKTAAQADIQLTNVLLTVMDHLHNGRLHSQRLVLQHDTAWVLREGRFSLAKALAGGTIRAAIEACQPRSWAYRSLQGALASFTRLSGLDSLQVDFSDTDSSAKYQIAQRALMKQGYLRTATALDSLSLMTGRRELKTAIWQFQQENGLEADSKLGTKTCQALSHSNWDRFQQIAANLERLRWEKDTSSTYLLVNLPAFQLLVCEQNTVRQTYRLIVGKPSMPSPTLDSRINSIIIAPQWNVPYSIATKEMLPRIKENLAYLTTNNLSVLDKNNQVVDPQQIDWRQLSARNFPYRIQQASGCDNALGNILFHFPNPYSIYLHDTPERRIFGRVNRALSHGCIRVENPVSLAKWLLDRELSRMGITTEEVESCQQQRKRRQLNLKNPMPIRIRYLTCGAEGGKLHFYPDIYQHDAVVVNALFSSSSATLAVQF